MLKLKRDTSLRYGLAVLTVPLALVVTLSLWPQMQRTPFVLFFLAVVFSAWRGGAGPGLLATALAIILSKIFRIAPGDPTLYGFWEDALLRFVFLLNALLFVWLFASHRSSAEALRQSEERYREQFENANDIIYTHDLEGNYTSLNKVGERVTGYSRDEALKMNVRQVVAPEHLELARRMIERKVNEQVETCYEMEVIAKDGRRVAIEVSTQLIYAEGKPCGVHGIGRDITKRKQAEAALKESEERYRELFENANDIIYTHDLTGNFTSLNKVGERITGYSREEATRLNISQIVSPEHLEKARQMIALKIKGMEQATTVYESEIISKGGRRVPLELSTRVIYEDGKPVAIQGIARDITERKRTEETLRSLSLLDDLTGLYNRRGFLTLAEQQLKLAQRTGRGFALIFADLDGLKRINDTYGHHQGDRALIKTADILRKSFRESDITARLAGDEFTILALEDYEGSPEAITTRLMDNLKSYNAEEDRPYDLSLSVGVVHFNPESECSIEELMAEADEAMYEHKQSKKGRRELYSEFVL